MSRPERKTAQLQVRVTAAEKAALARLARRAGQDVSSYVLSRALPPAAARLAGLVRSLGDARSRRYALVELNDWLAEATTDELPDVAHGEFGELEPWLQNYVAAMVERAAQRQGVAPPVWVRRIEALDEPYFATTMLGLRAHLLRSSPVVFRRRNLFVDASIGDRV